MCNNALLAEKKKQKDFVFISGIQMLALAII